MNDTVPDNDDGSSSSSSEASSAYEPEYEWEEITIPGVALVLPNENGVDDNGHQDDENESINNAVFSLHVLTVVPPPLEYMSRLHSQQQEISGRQVWTGSLFLAHVLFHDATERQLLLSCQQKRILELGSGTGVLGMALYKFLSLRHNNSYNNHHHHPIVALTDGDIKAVDLLQQNLSHADNRKAMLPHDHHNGGDDDEKDDNYCCKATCLQWGVPDSLNQFHNWCRKSWASTPCSRRINSPSTSSTNHGTGQAADEEEAENISSLPPSFVFDVIVAGDVLYKPDLPQIFFDTVRQLLLRRQQEGQQDQQNDDQSDGDIGSGDAGILWLCHVPRSTVTHELVLHAANQAGFKVERTVSLDSLKKTRNDKSIKKLLDACPLEDVARARVHRMVLQKKKD